MVTGDGMTRIVARITIKEQAQARLEIAYQKSTSSYTN
jgi:hypothetical protein